MKDWHTLTKLLRKWNIDYTSYVASKVKEQGYGPSWYSYTVISETGSEVVIMINDNNDGYQAGQYTVKKRRK